jgi:hypothetical protein
VGSEHGSSQCNLFSHFHHFTAEPQRLPNSDIFWPLKYLVYVFRDHLVNFPVLVFCAKKSQSTLVIFPKFDGHLVHFSCSVIRKVKAFFKAFSITMLLCVNA